ncbi:phBC6A51 family helix-turn-helix protein [Paenibacillus sp. 1P03SA]|uniref:phBC6A51 family helix-turn-helix protein n=1 Tax=Paenibacillus sp. 1P03SA TaxID=3132294 RepID=UPI0039A1E408
MTMKTGLSAPQRRAAEILATDDKNEYTMPMVAEEVGCSERTLFRWRQDPEFIAYKNEVADRAMDDFLSDTYRYLRRLASSGLSEGARLKAIELVLKNRGKLQDVQRIDQTIRDNRSDAAIEAEIERLRQEMGE